MGQPSKECFVICPLGAKYSETRYRSDQLYEKVFRPAAEEEVFGTGVFIRSQDLADSIE